MRNTRSDAESLVYVVSQPSVSWQRQGASGSRYPGAATMGHSTGASENIKLEPPCEPPVPLLGIDPEEMKSGGGGDACPPMLAAALFTTAKVQRHPSIHGWTRE